MSTIIDRLVDTKEANDFVMHTSRHNTLCLRLISILILLIGLSINGYGDAEPLVVTILDRWSDGPAVPARSDAEILADRILARKTADFFFDIPRRNQLVGEIEGCCPSFARLTRP